MPRRTVQERAADMAAKVERIAKISPTAGALIEEWLDRLIAGESLESLQPEMDRLVAEFKKHKRG